MTMMVADGVRGLSPMPPPPPREAPAGGAPAPVPSGSYRPDPTYHPQVQAPAAGAGAPPNGPYAIPAGSTLGEVASGTQAQPFDVTLSQLATAVYGTRGAPPAGWNEVTDQQLQDLGVADPQAWRLQYLGANDSVPTNDQEFRAEVYTDGQGNYVLSYRGTAEGGADWDNNFRQGLGYETRDGDKFGVTAVNTAREFARVFGDDRAEPSNLAITGHSQGGGLASVGALASGVPAVTFDASGIHPNTLDRIGIDPQAARDTAEGGQIRAYSLSSDALTNAQDSWATGLLAPDALGTQIVVKPASADEHQMFTNYGPTEGFSPGLSETLNTGVEIARHTPLLPFNPVTGLVTGGANLVGNVAYAAISHSPNALTAGMIEHQPWQAGYENPSSLGRDLQNLLPDAAKDDYARNVHDFATDVDAVVANEFANGDYVLGGARLVGDLAEGVLNSIGDTVDGYADQLAGQVKDSVGGWAGDVLSGAIDGAGDVAEFATDVAGQAAETVVDGVGWVAQGATNLVGSLFGR
ncbi:Mbeg1-like protein [Luteimonas sp. TWI662]|uniref:Mbeg1-like protein n=1 Tax=Luteimonas sp. TWI662 TaxID=3136789 RepID=UPI003207E6D7